MNRPAQTPETDLSRYMLELGTNARAAGRALAGATAEARNAGLHKMADALRSNQGAILEANARDVEGAKAKGLSDAMIDRLALTPERIEGMAAGLDAIADLPDPVGEEIARWTVPSGLDIARVRTPLGVIGIIYESRPNVTADAGGLCIRSGNAVILRGGSESLHTSSLIADYLRTALKSVELPENAIQYIATTDRAAVGHLLMGLDGQVDVVVPRGGRSLYERVQSEARIPIIGHLEGLVHIYHDGSLPLDEAIEIILNAKLRRTGICGALETLLLKKSDADQVLPPLVEALRAADCEVRGDEGARAIVPDLVAATEEDWRTEYLAKILSVRLIDGLDEALAHIERYGSSHTEAVLTTDPAIAERFMTEVDAGIVMHNASTQFADGGEFGMGAEIGISTGRIHARGPVGAEQLTLFKYKVRGTGQTRPK